MKFDIITIFPKAFDSYFSASILARARKKKLIDIQIHNLRRWTKDRHRSVDDKPYGGGPGMIFKVEPIYRAVEAIRSKGYGVRSRGRKPTSDTLHPTPYVVLFSAKGKVLTQETVRKLAKKKWLILICGHYEGVDERVAKYIADEEISIGEYVLTGGEIPAMAVVDAVSRLISGVLGKNASLIEESFSKQNYREYPQYTRPEVFHPKVKGQKSTHSTSSGLMVSKAEPSKVKRHGWKVPKVLLSGDHLKIAEWRRRHAHMKQK